MGYNLKVCTEKQTIKSKKRKIPNKDIAKIELKGYNRTRYGCFEPVEYIF